MDSAVDRLMTLKVKDVMTRRVACVQQHQSLSDAARLFVDKGISGAPVINADGVCVGMLSAVDYVKREQALVGKDHDNLSGAHVSEQMSAGVRSVQPEQTLLTAARIMCEKHLHRLPVLDQQGKLTGLITAMDVVAALVNAIDERETLAM